ncbi:hypothetical protein WDZ92_14485 [Nostoc sp. NIES-2111]
MIKFLGALAVIFSVSLAAVAQVMIKRELTHLGPAPSAIAEWPGYALSILLTPGIILAFMLAFVGAMAYLFAISRLPITYLYPFASLSFPAVLVLGVLVIGETFTWQKAAGSALIIGGVIINSMSQS